MPDERDHRPRTNDLYQDGATCAVLYLLDMRYCARPNTKHFIISFQF